ncbi:hypothetical protein EDB82DRAFT_323684 [Fusarium venenatum]|uniref:uncharacterized protein n=1 Tax=Fusarium venenatum TaxID=56646 RepID=UPI001D4AB5A6|nr:hypothetical protein EDB82DRAFT_323684 [Fusarium venenatum]
MLAGSNWMATSKVALACLTALTRYHGLFGQVPHEHQLPVPLSCLLIITPGKLKRRYLPGAISCSLRFSSEWLLPADQDSNVNRFVGDDWFGTSNYDGLRLMRPGVFSEIAVCCTFVVF